MENSDHTYVVQGRWSSVEEIVDATRLGGLRLDLGCGYYRPEGYVGLDNLVGAPTQVVDAERGPDVLMDLNRDPLPFPDNSCEEVRSSHFLEHSVLDHVISESYRVLKPGATFHFTVPYANSAEGMYPGHLVFLTEKWFHENINFQRMFTIVEERFDPSDDWFELPRILRRLVPFELARKHLFNACKQMTVTAQPLK